MNVQIVHTYSVCTVQFVIVHSATIMIETPKITNYFLCPFSPNQLWIILISFIVGIILAIVSKCQ